MDEVLIAYLWLVFEGGCDLLPALHHLLSHIDVAAVHVTGVT